jgi:hypothetical protein
MSVILQFSPSRRQAPPHRVRDGSGAPMGSAEVLIFPGVRRERSIGAQQPAARAVNRAPDDGAAGACGISGADE